MGVFGLLPDSWLIGVISSSATIHALFSLLLYSLIIVRFGWWRQHTPTKRSIDIRLISRELSRMIYLILYLVIGTQEIIHIWEYPHGVPRLAQGFSSTGATNVQSFLMSGIVALMLIRGLAFWSARRFGRD